MNERRRMPMKKGSFQSHKKCFFFFLISAADSADGSFCGSGHEYA